MFCKRLVTMSLLSVVASGSVRAEDIFRQLDVGTYAPEGQCAANDGQGWWVLDSGIVTATMVCLNLDSSRDGDGYYLFMNCGGPNGIVTYMGTWKTEPPNSVQIDLTEYRGASGAPDIVLQLERCR